jgi:hypothetical protein
MTKSSRTPKAPARCAELTVNDFDVINALLEPHDYMLMAEDDGSLALYRIVRGAGYGGYDRYDKA